ncbi:MAG TPA: hypothetical protein VKZ49_16440 [Polyangiaceae bacterium]|nr:hypothetical protein [Polyangiaceae bacterium]
MNAHEAEYRIIDEPKRGGLAHLAVNPLWVFLAMMLGGAWLGWPWFVLNSFAIGSATKAREIGLVVAGLLGAIALTWFGFYLVRAGSIDGDNLAYAATALIALKLGITYFVFLPQSRSYELFQYFEGETRQGFLIVIAGMLLRSRVLDALPNEFWRFVLL